MDHVDHPSTASPSSSSISSHTGMMVPYLHFAGGDNLFFESWTPSSAGALVGACVGLILLAIIERWLAATRSVFDAHWHRRSLVMTAARDQVISAQHLTDKSELEPPTIVDGIQEISRETSTKSTDLKSRIVRQRLRTIAPFIPAHDIPRGILYAIQMLLGYTLMLAVMTYQAAFIISIILGLGIGEIAFGRAGRGGAGH